MAPVDQPDRNEFARQGAALRERRGGLTATGFLIGMNVAVYVWMCLSGASPFDPDPETLLGWGANYGSLTLGSEWWRAVAAIFIHIGLLHLLCNMYVLLQIGRILERQIGGAAVFAIFMLTGIFSSVVATLLRPDVVSAGASGAIMGLFGVFWALLICRGIGLPAKTIASLNRWAVIFVLICVAYGATDENISQEAHLSGVAAGLLFGFAIGKSALAGRGRVFVRRMFEAGASVALLTVAAVLLPPSRERLVQMAENADDPKTAVAYYGKAVARFGEDADLLAARAEAYEDSGDVKASIADLDRAIKLDPNSEKHLLQRGRLLLEDGKSDLARADADRALKLKPQDAGALYLSGLLKTRKKDFRGALSDFRAVPADAANHRSARVEQAYCLSRLGYYDASLALFDALREEGAPSLFLWTVAAEDYRQLKLYYKALDAGNQALQAAIDGGYSDDAIADIRFQRAFDAYALGEDAQAVDDWRAAADLDEDKSNQAGTLENIGLVLTREGKWTEALANCDAVDRIDDTMAWNALFRAIAADKLGQAASATAAYGRWEANKAPDDLDELGRLLGKDLQPYLHGLPDGK